MLIVFVAFWAGMVSEERGWEGEEGEEGSARGSGGGSGGKGGMSRSPLKKNTVCCTDIIMLIVFLAFWAGMVRFCFINYEGSLREGHGGRGEEGRK